MAEVIENGSQMMNEHKYASNSKGNAALSLGKPY